MNNFIPDTNRFALAAPPRHFLQRLAEFDPSLVIIPSRQSPVYRLAQRRPLKLPEKMVNEAIFNESDTKMMASYGLIPVTTILSSIEWSDPFIFVELERRCPHRMGGADAATALVEEQEAKDELRKQAHNDEMLNYLAKDSWGMYNKHLGLRSHAFINSRVKTRREIVGGKSAALSIKNARQGHTSRFVA